MVFHTTVRIDEPELIGKIIAPCGRLATLDAVDCMESMSRDFEGSSVARSDQAVGERGLETVDERQRLMWRRRSFQGTSR